MRVLVLGAAGMLGNAVFSHFARDERFDVWGTIRDPQARRHFPRSLHGRLMHGVDVVDVDGIISVLRAVCPQVVINCIGLIKQLGNADDPLAVLPINSIYPHRLARLCALNDIRLIHVSTDCVFSGRKGNYSEEDTSDADDLYGRSKYIGEVRDMSNAITLRTSIIGHELSSRYALVDWFLSQDKCVKGYANAIFSGLPTNEFAKVIKDHVLPRPSLNGLYHVAAAPISKLKLLQLLAAQYGKCIEITPDEGVIINRSLDASRFHAATGYSPPPWPDLIRLMHIAYLQATAAKLQ